MLTELENILISTLEDLTLSASERDQLASLAQTITAEQRRFLKNRAFDLCRPKLIDNSDSHNEEQRRQCYRWLEKAIKALSPDNRASSPGKALSLAFFSPGSVCKDTIISSCTNAKKSIDICVFTISDNQISESIISAHVRGVAVRIISDNHKSEDRGSDIQMFFERGLDVRLDRSDNHMHHKFAIFDDSLLLNGSFNWTRSASERNEENLVRHDNPELIDMFAQQFDTLWSRYKI